MIPIPPHVSVWNYSFIQDYVICVVSNNIVILYVHKDWLICLLAFFSSHFVEFYNILCTFTIHSIRFLTLSLSRMHIVVILYNRLPKTYGTFLNSGNYFPWYSDTKPTCIERIMTILTLDFWNWNDVKVFITLQERNLHVWCSFNFADRKHAWIKSKLEKQNYKSRINCLIWILISKINIF